MSSFLYMSDSVSNAEALSEMEEALSKQADEIRVRAASLNPELLAGSPVNCKTCNKKFTNSLGHDCCPSHVACLVNKTEYVPSKCKFCQSALGYAILEARKGDVKSVQFFQGVFQNFWRKLKRARDSSGNWVEPKFTSVFKSRPLVEVAKLSLSDIVDPDSITQHGNSEAGSSVGSKVSQRSKISRSSSVRTSSSSRARMNSLMEALLQKVDKLDKDREEDRRQTQESINKAMETVSQRFFENIPALPDESDAQSSFSGFSYKHKGEGKTSEKAKLAAEKRKREKEEDDEVALQEDNKRKKETKGGKELEKVEKVAKDNLVKDKEEQVMKILEGKTKEKVVKNRKDNLDRKDKETKGKDDYLKEEEFQVKVDKVSKENVAKVVITEEVLIQDEDLIPKDRSRSPNKRQSGYRAISVSPPRHSKSLVRDTELLKQHLVLGLSPPKYPSSHSLPVRGSRFSSPGVLTPHSVVAETHHIPSSPNVPSTTPFKIPKIPSKKPLLPSPSSPSIVQQGSVSPVTLSPFKEFSFAFVDVPVGHKVVSVTVDPGNASCMVPQKLMNPDGVVYDVRPSRSHSLPPSSTSPLLPVHPSHSLSSSRPSLPPSPSRTLSSQTPQDASSRSLSSSKINPSSDNSNKVSVPPPSSNQLFRDSCPPSTSFSPSDDFGRVDLKDCYDDFTGCTVFDTSEYKVEEDAEVVEESPYEQKTIRKPASVADVCKNKGQWFDMSKNVKLMFFSHKPDLLHYITLFDDTTFLARVVSLFLTKGVVTHFKIRLDHRIKVDQAPKSFKPLVSAAIMNSVPVLLKADKPDFPVCRDFKKSCLVTLTGEPPYPHDFSVYRKWLQEMVNNSEFQFPLDNLPPTDFLFTASDTADLLAPFYDEEISRNAVSQEFNIPLTMNIKLPVKLVKAEFEARYEVAKTLVAFQGVNSAMATLQKLQGDKMALSSKNSMYGFMPSLSFVLTKAITRWLRAKLALRRSALISSQSEDVNLLLMSDPFESSLFCVQTVEEVRSKLQQADKSLRSLVAKDGPASRSAAMARARAIKAKYGRYVSNRSDSSEALKSFSTFRSNTRPNFRQRNRGSRVSNYVPVGGKNRGKGRGGAPRNLLFRGGYRGASSKGSRGETSSRGRNARQDTSSKFNN